MQTAAAPPGVSSSPLSSAGESGHVFLSPANGCGFLF